jgi:hypothetical protein
MKRESSPTAPRALVAAGLALIAWTAAGCGDAGVTAIDPASLPGVTQCAEVDAASGKLVVARERRPEKGKIVRVPALCPADYAVWVVWPNREWDPDGEKRHEFTFYDNVRKRCYRTRDFEAFLKVLAAQPRNIEIVKVDTCTVSNWYIDDPQFRRLEKVMAAGGRRWVDSPTNGLDRMLICTCDEH